MLAPTAQKILAILLCVVGLFFVAMGIRMGLRDRDMNSRAVVTAAALSDIRERGDSDTGIVANYAFEVNGVRYHRVGLFGEVSADITPEQASDPSRTIDVRYLPDDPWVNEPANAPTSGSSKAIAAAVVGIALLLGAAFRWFSARSSSGH